MERIQIMLKSKTRQLRVFYIVILLLFSGCNKNNSIIQNTTLKENHPGSDTIMKCNGYSELCHKRLDEITTLMTHNSYNSRQGKFLFPNQNYSVYKQLSDGVRGLMLDVYSSSKGPLLYHGYTFLGKKPLKTVLIDIKKFLSENPNEVITIIFENYCTDGEILDDFRAAGLNDMIFVYDGIWPTLQEMIQENKRLVLFIEKNNGKSTPELLHAWTYIFDTKYSFMDVASMDSKTNRGGEGEKTFFLLNHWVTNKFGLPVKSRAYHTNSSEVLRKRVKDTFNEQKRVINFLGVDFYETGAARVIVDSLNGIAR